MGTIVEIKAPEVTKEQRTKFGILCSLEAMPGDTDE